jgi:hypothetical protein
MNEVLTTAFRDSAVEEHRLSNGTHLKHRQISVEKCEHSEHLSTSCIDENKKVCRFSVKTYEVPFQSQLAVQPVIWNLPANSKGELGYASNLCEIYAIFAHW